MILDLKYYPHPVLAKPAAKCEVGDPELPALIESMRETMYAKYGMGLAAPQVGVSKAVFVMDVGEIGGKPTFNTFINPVILSRKGKQEGREGCLSMPGAFIPLHRASVVTVSYQDLQGERHEAVVDGIVSRVVQHEIDHLNGVFFIAHLSRLARGLLLKKYKAP